MFQQFDLSIESESLDAALDDIRFEPIELNVMCTETGFTTILVRLQEAEEPQERRFKRRFRRFLLLGGRNDQLLHLLNDKKIRVIKRHDFFTEQGAVIVLDYEIKPKE